MTVRHLLGRMGLPKGSCFEEVSTHLHGGCAPRREPPALEPKTVTRRTAVSETSPKLRAELEGIPTYKPGKPAAAGGRVAYKLSSNENPYPPLPGVMESVTAAASSFNRY